jgi:dolichyl-phosphate-mannose-protein mannosyltransferase
MVSPDPTEGRRGIRPGVLLGCLILLAIALRFWRLGTWNLEGDEIFTLRDSLSPRFTNPRPLLYFLNYYLVQPFGPLDELSLRILPAIFGVLAIPAFYLITRRLVGTRAALFGTLLLTFSGLHVYQSQYARYWSLVFLLSSVYPFAIFLGVRDRDRWMLAVGAVTGILAVLAHPAAILLLGGLALFWLARPPFQHFTRLMTQKSVRWTALLTIVVAAAVAVRYVPILRSWILVRPGLHIGEHLLFTPKGLGITQIALTLSFVDALTVPVVLAGALGIYLLRQNGERTLARLLTCLFVFPVGFIILLSFLTAVSTTYLLPAAPIPFIGAGVFLDHIAAVTSSSRPRYLVPVTVVVIMMVAGAPTLISQYRDGRRFDFRGAARWLEPQLKPEDVVFSDQFWTMRHYLRKTEAQRLVADTALLQQTLDQLQQSRRGGTLWIVAPYSARGGHRTTANLGSFKQWIYHNCRLRNVVGVARLDYRVNELQIYECPSAAPAVSTSGT